jgi:hypothetical protein
MKLTFTRIGYWWHAVKVHLLFVGGFGGMLMISWWLLNSLREDLKDFEKHEGRVSSVTSFWERKENNGRVDSAMIGVITLEWDRNRYWAGGGTPTGNSLVTLVSVGDTVQLYTGGAGHPVHKKGEIIHLTSNVYHDQPVINYYRKRSDMKNFFGLSLMAVVLIFLWYMYRDSWFVRTFVQGP